MGTTTYFDKMVKDAAREQDAQIECGTTGYAGAGPQLFLKFNEGSIIMSHEDAKEFCEAVAGVARYFRYSDD